MNQKKIRILKILGVIGAILLLLFGVAIIIVSNKIKNMDIKGLIISEIEKAAPGAKAHIENLDLSIGTSIAVDIKGLKLDLKENPGFSDSKLLEIKNLSMNLPLMAVLTKGGDIQISAEAPELNYFENKSEKNWSMAFPQEKVTKQKNGPKRVAKSTNKEIAKSSKKEVLVEEQTDKNEVPDFLKKSKVNITLKSILINYKLANNEKGTVILDKLRVKNFSLSQSTAYELNVKLNKEIKKGELTTVSAILIGEVNLHEYLEGKKLITNYNIQLRDMRHKEIDLGDTVFKSNGKIIVDPKGSVELGGELDLEKLGNLTFNAKKESKKITLEKIKFSFNVIEILKVLDANNSNVSGDKALFEGSGSLVIFDNLKVSPDLDIKIKPGFEYTMKNGVVIATDGFGKWSSKELSLDLTSRLLKGSVDLKIRGKLNSLDFSKDIIGSDKIKVDLNIVNLVMNKKQLRSFLYPKSANEEDEKEDQEEESTNTAKSEEKDQQVAKSKVSTPPKRVESKKPVELPNILVSAKWSKVYVDSAIFQGEANVFAKGSRIKSEGIFFKYSKGSGSVDFDVNLADSDKIKSKIKFKVNNLNLDSMKVLIPMKVRGISGTFTGNLDGNIDYELSEKKEHYDIDASMTVADGQIDKLNVSESIKDTITKIPVVGSQLSKKEIKISNKFEKLIFNGNFKKEKFDIKNFTFNGSDKNADMTGKGVIHPLKDSPKSQLFIDYKDRTGSVSKPLVKNTGSDILPLLLEGPQFDLKPNINYTLNKASKRVYKNEGQKALKKLGDKLFKGKNKDDVKKLFKGLFK